MVMDSRTPRVRRSLTLKLWIFAGVVLLIVVVAGYEAFVKPTGKLLEEAVLKKGMALCRTMAYNVNFDVVMEDRPALVKTAQGVISEPDVLYALIWNGQGTKILLQESSGDLGSEALDTAEKQVQHQGTADAKPILLRTASGRMFYDVASPVRGAESSSSVDEFSQESSGSKGPVGYVHLGIAIENIRQTTQEFRRRLLIVILLMAIPGLAAYLTMLVFVIKPLTRMAAIADRVAAGDLTEGVGVRSADEIGLLAGSFNQMLEALRNLARELRMAGGKLSTSAVEILTAAEDQSASSREQSVSVNETTATMEELAQTSKQIAENSDGVARAAEDTFQNAKAAAKAVEDTIAGMMSIKSQTEQNTNKIFALGDKIQDIGNVVTMINDIADQTKLIAFNAAIEAAGAGDAGKRFSIVAGEVRRLADTVVESIDQIKRTITEIQLATNELILSSEKGVKDVEEGVNVASRGGEALQKIISMIKHTTESSRQISLSTQQQRTASEQVVISMKEVSKTASQTATSSKQTIAIASQLNQLSEQLTQVVKRFELGDGHRLAVGGAAAPEQP